MRKDGGYSWFIAVVAFFAVALAVIFPTFGSISVLVQTWIQDFGFSEEEVGHVSSVLSIFMYLPGPLYNIFIRITGTWRAQIMAAFLLVAGSIGTAFSTQLWHLILSYSLLHGAGAALTQMICIAVIKDYFNKYRSAVYAASYAGNSFGVLLCPPVLQYLLRTIKYRYSLLIMGSVVVVTAISAAFAYRGDGSIVKDENLNVIVSDENNPKTINDCVESESLIGETESLTLLTKFKLEARSHLDMLKNPYYILTLCSFIFIGITQNIFYTYIIQFGVSTGLTNAIQGALGQTVMGTASLMAASLLALLMKFNREPVAFHIFTAIGSGTAMLLFPLVSNLMGYYLVNFVAGFTEAMIIANGLQNIQTFSHEGIDIRMSYIYAASGVGYALGPLIAGTLIKPFGIAYVFLVSGYFGIASGMVLLPVLVRSLCVTYRG